MNPAVVVAVILQGVAAGLFVLGCAVLLGSAGLLLGSAVVLFALGWALEARYSG